MSDAYSVAVPKERFEEAMRIFTACRLRRPVGAVWRCAKDAAAGAFCPCITAAGGGIGSRDRVIFEAVAAEIERRVIGHSAPQAAAGLVARDVEGQIARGGPEPDLKRVLAEEAIDETLKATFPASDAPCWTLGPAH